MNEDKHLLADVKTYSANTVRRYIVVGLCGIQIDTDYQPIVGATEYDYTCFTSYGGIETTSFRHKKSEVDCGDCLLIALAKEAEYDYAERSKANARLATDR